MIITDNIIQINTHNVCKYLPDFQRSIFFDIETTGLHRKYSQLYLLGIAFYENGVWRLRQWFSQKPSDEAEILQAFLNFITDYRHIIHYNGTSFDLPYLKSRCFYSQIDAAALDRLTGIDLYRSIKPFQKLLDMTALTLKDAEQLLQIDRVDRYRGAELIPLYHEYLLHKDEQLRSAMLLHNAEDVLHLTQLLPLLAYPRLFESDLSAAVITQTDKFITVVAQLKDPLPRPIEYRHHQILLQADGNQLVIQAALFCGELKYYYDNPRDYYYLPAEDQAVHKSIGTYVDRNYRRPANKSNCYQRQSGLFAPQYDTVFTPVFKTDYKDPVLFFPCDRPKLLPDHWKHLYASHLIEVCRRNIIKKSSKKDTL